VLIVRVTEEEYDGVDLSEFGLHVYPEFVERQGASGYPGPGHNVRTGDILEGRISESEQ